MASQDAIREVIGRAIADASFRASIIADAKSATREAGFDFSEEQIAALKAFDIGSFAEELDERISKFHLT